MPSRYIISWFLCHPRPVLRTNVVVLIWSFLDNACSVLVPLSDGLCWGLACVVVNINCLLKTSFSSERQQNDPGVSNDKHPLNLRHYRVIHPSHQMLSAATLTLTWSKNTRKVRCKGPWLCWTELRNSWSNSSKLIARTVSQGRFSLHRRVTSVRLQCCGVITLCRNWIRVKSETCNLCTSGSCIRSNRRIHGTWIWCWRKDFGRHRCKTSIKFQWKVLQEWRDCWECDLAGRDTSFTIQP